MRKMLYTIFELLIVDMSQELIVDLKNYYTCSTFLIQFFKIENCVLV